MFNNSPIQPTKASEELYQVQFLSTLLFAYMNIII